MSDPAPLTEAEERELRGSFADEDPHLLVCRLLASLDAARAEAQRMREALEMCRARLTRNDNMVTHNEALACIDGAIAPERSRSDE